MKPTFNVFVLLLILILTQTQDTVKTQNPSLQKIIQISPSALDVLVHAFDHVIIFFHSKLSQADLESHLEAFQLLKEQIRFEFPDDHSLFGYVNMTEDYNKNLERFGNNQGFSILNRFTPSSDFKIRYGEESLFETYQKLAHPKLLITYSKQALAFSSFSHNLLFKFKDTDKLRQYNKIFEKSKYYFNDLDVGLYAVPVEKNETESLTLYHFNHILNEYRLKNLTIEELATQLVQEVNIDTLPLVTKLEENNLHRIFGGSISDQLLLIYKESISEEELNRVRKQFLLASSYNKEEQLAYERLLFAEMTSQFFEEHFSEEANSLFKQNQQKDYAIIFTKTDYDRFNLKKYILKEGTNNLDLKMINSFVEDVRMKRLEPRYMSEAIPRQEQNQGILRKIVGNTFINEVYQKPDQSLIILFYDSKEESSSVSIMRVLQEFALKYKEEFEGKITFGVFDLAKNQHKLLYLKEAPQIVLFDKANKKHSKYFKIAEGVSISALEEWVIREVSNARIDKLADQM